MISVHWWIWLSCIFVNMLTVAICRLDDFASCEDAATPYMWICECDDRWQITNLNLSTSTGSVFISWVGFHGLGYYIIPRLLGSRQMILILIMMKMAIGDENENGDVNDKQWKNAWVHFHPVALLQLSKTLACHWHYRWRHLAEFHQHDHWSSWNCFEADFYFWLTPDLIPCACA